MSKRKLKKRHFRKMKWGFRMAEMRRWVEDAFCDAVVEIADSLTDEQRKLIFYFGKGAPL